MARIAETEPHEEAVELRFGQREGAFVIDRVLRGDDEERRFERVGLAVGGDAPLGHRFEQGRLRARRGAVDFVGRAASGRKSGRGGTRTRSSSG